MKSIKVGVLVRIIPGERGYLRAHDVDGSVIRVYDFIGHLGKVLAQSHKDEAHWVVEGAETHEGVEITFHERVLEPIDPGLTPADEDFVEDLKQWMGTKNGSEKV